MIKIKIGGWPFMLPQRWSEVSQIQAKKLAETSVEDMRKRLFILGKIPEKKFIELDESVVIAAYEIISFVEELPEFSASTMDIQGSLKWIENDWTFDEFERARQIIVKRKREISTSLVLLAEIKGYKENYIEAGLRILEGVGLFVEQYAKLGIFDKVEPSAIEILAGVERLEVFTIYPILKQAAERYGKYPGDIARKPVGWVMKDYAHQVIESKVTENIHKLQNEK